MLLLVSLSPQVAFVGSKIENAVNVRLSDRYTVGLSIFEQNPQMSFRQLSSKMTTKRQQQQLTKEAKQNKKREKYQSIRASHEWTGGRTQLFINKTLLLKIV